MSGGVPVAVSSPAVPRVVHRTKAGVLRGEAFGVAFEARVDDARLLAAVRVRLPPGWRPARRAPAVIVSLERGSAGRRKLRVRLDGQAVADGLGQAHALDVLESELQLSVARLARPEVFVHAGVVAVGGRAILIPGRSGTGKTTLVRALVEAGATYYSDEYAVLDARGRVHPYPRRPSVRGRGRLKRRHAVPRLRGRSPVPVGLVLETRYRKGARWAPAPLSAGECVLALLANTVPARDRPREVLATLARATAGAQGIRTERSAASRTARALVRLVQEGEDGRTLRRSLPRRRARS